MVRLWKTISLTKVATRDPRSLVSNPPGARWYGRPLG